MQILTVSYEGTSVPDFLTQLLRAVARKTGALVAHRETGESYAQRATCHHGRNNIVCEKFGSNCVSARTRRNRGMRTAGAMAQDFQMPKSPNLASAVAVVDRIYLVRGIKVILDSDLAALYGVPTKAFNQAVRRNIERFPADFLLKLSLSEFESLRSQFVTLEKSGRGQHRKHLPLAFTEHGAIMAASILNSARAVEMSTYVVRAFVRTRELLSSHAVLARELTALKKSVASLDASTRSQFDQVYEAILGLMNPAVRRQ